MEILAYCLNTCNSSNPIIKKVEKLGFLKNREFSHDINKENLFDFFNPKNQIQTICQWSFLFNISKNELIKNMPYQSNDYFIDFIKISY